MSSVIMSCSFVLFCVNIGRNTSNTILDGERGKRLSPLLESEAAPQGLAEFQAKMFSPVFKKCTEDKGSLG